MMLSSYRS